MKPHLIEWSFQANKGSQVHQIYTYEEYKGCGHSYLHLVTDIFRPPYQDQALKEIHNDHLSAQPIQARFIFLRSNIKNI